jgi:hypothetical protein
LFPLPGKWLSVIVLIRGDYLFPIVAGFLLGLKPRERIGEGERIEKIFKGVEFRPRRRGKKRISKVMFAVVEVLRTSQWSIGQNVPLKGFISYLKPLKSLKFKLNFIKVEKPLMSFEILLKQHETIQKFLRLCLKQYKC